MTRAELMRHALSQAHCPASEIADRPRLIRIGIRLRAPLPVTMKPGSINAPSVAIFLADFVTVYSVVRVYARMNKHVLMAGEILCRSKQEKLSISS